MTLFEALFERKYRSPIYWDDIREKKLVGPEMIIQMVDMINLILQHLKATQDQ